MVINKNLLSNKNKKKDKISRLLLVALQKNYEKYIFHIIHIAIYSIIIKIS